MKILIVEDHPELGSLLDEELCKCGFATDLTASGEQALSLLKLSHYDAIVLDLGLPDIDGMRVLNSLPQLKQKSIPCIVLTARDDLDSRIEALNCGADDYILKPFEFSELEARLRAVLRRTGQRQDMLLRYADLCFDPQRRELSSDQHSIILPRREALLVEALFQAAPRVVIKDHLEDCLYGLQESTSVNAVEALISRTRRKLSSMQSRCKIQTKRGIGYCLVG